MSKLKVVKPSFLTRYRYSILASIVIAGLGVWSYFRFIQYPAEVYYINDTPYAISANQGNVSTDVNGCQIITPVRCPQGAACTPYKVCVATPVTVTTTSQTTVTRSPLPTVTPTPTTPPSGCYTLEPSCAPGRMCAQPARLICPTDDAVLPTQNPTPTPKPSLIPSPDRGMLRSLTATGPCAGDLAFSNYTVLCDNNSSPRLKLSNCTEYTTAYDVATQACLAK